MKRHFVGFMVCLAGLAALHMPASAAQMAVCSADFSTCAVPENVLLQFPAGFLAVAGDVVVVEANHTTVSDVLRFFNDLVDTGGGTGLGTTAFLYSSDDSTPLPNPSTYSLNAVAIPEDPSGYTHYFGNGTEYVLNAPEPATFGLLAGGWGLLTLIKTKRLASRA